MVEYSPELDQVFGSLSDPTRRDILNRVARQDMSVGEIAAHYPLTFAAIAKHLVVLERAKLIRKSRRGKEQIVAISPQTLAVASDYLEKYRELWESRLDSLDRFLNSINGQKEQIMQPIKEIHLERVYDAPVAQVWRAWTDPEMLKQWWGPDNVGIPRCEVDLRVGGTFYIVMEAGEAMGPYKGTLWPMRAKYTVVEPCARLSYTANAWTEGHEADTQIDQVTEIDFSEAAGKTTVRIRAVINKLGPSAGMAAEGMQAGFTQQLGKLEGFLRSQN
jgi:uncharacterized protein YndB with AHSA1/START domain/DNA-binding transcriptional ArsR family regulator